MNLVMFETAIRQDKDGRYCLNDLHKAAIASGLPVARKNPAEFFRTDMANNFVESVKKITGELTVILRVNNGGKNPGTYTCKELLFAYALWIDNRIFLKIIKAIDDLSIIQEALNNFEVPDDIPDMYVYAIKNKDTGNIKLGISKNPEQRLKQLQTGCDGKLELVAYRKADNGYRDELQLHNENNQYAIHGEWFTKDAKFN